jgi:hypothetical protein
MVELFGKSESQRVVMLVAAFAVRGGEELQIEAKSAAKMKRYKYFEVVSIVSV